MMASTCTSTQADSVKCKILGKTVPIGDSGETVPMMKPILDNFDMFKAHFKNLGGRVPLFAKFVDADITKAKLRASFDAKLDAASTIKQVAADTNLVVVDNATIANLKRVRQGPVGVPKAAATAVKPMPEGAAKPGK